MQRVTAISGVGVKGPACFLYEAAGLRLLLDLGRGPDGDNLPVIDGLGRIDAILFSHGHVDHTGGLVLWEALGRPPLYATRPTIALSNHAELKIATPLEECERIYGITLETGPCGHAPGAVWMRLGGKDGLVYSGDVSLESTLFRSSLPPRAKALIFDASYGVANIPLSEQIAKIDRILDAEPILFPCPAGGRGLEMARHFLEKGLPVSLCPSHRQVAETLLSHESWLTAGGCAVLDDLLSKGGHLETDSPLEGVMIAAGPNAERGAAKAIAERLIATKSGQIVFTGHIAGGQPSEAMVRNGTARFLRWNVHPRLGEQRRLLEAVAPQQALAAFCHPQALAELRAETGWPIAPGTVMEW